MNLTKKHIIIAASIFGVVVIVLVALLLRSNSQMDEMTEVFSEERQQLVADYEDLSVAYEGMHTENDSLDNLLGEQRARVEQLTEELKTLKASNARRIKELQGELTTLRTVMRSFIVQIDSLNATNNALRQQNTEMKDRLADVSREKANLQEQNESLSQKVSVAQRLEAVNVVATPLNAKGRKTSSLSKAAKIQVSFTLAKNISAEVGMRDIYLRITRPDGDVLFHSPNDTFRFEDADIKFSAKRSIEYGGEDTPASIYYDVEMGDLMAGQYDAELFADGAVIGRTNFSVD